MTKKKPTDADKRVKALAKIARDKDRPKKERKAAQAELDALKGAFVPTAATGASTAEPSSPSTAADGRSTSPADSVDVASGDAGPLRAKQDAEVERQWKHLKATQATGGLGAPVKKVEAPTPVPIQIDDPAGISEDLIVDETPPVAAEDAPDAPTPDEPVNVPESPAQPPVDPLAKPADPVLENGNGQAMIHYRDPATGKEKVKGYTRVTTYIDCLDDKTVLNAWKHRTLLEGGAVELLQNGGTSPSLEAVARSVKRTDEALADIDRRTLEEGELLELRRQEVQKEHRDQLARIAEELMELGGAHEAANKGTDLHRLTEIVDNGHPLPAGTTASDRRDIEAYQAAMEALDVEVLWTEKRVVLDDIAVSGTMDRAFRIKLPGMGRKIRVVGDVKTGRIDFAPGKIGMQLALYARGLGYDWTDPLKRENLSLSKAHGLLIHLPQGKGECHVYLVDLELANQGLQLARAVREWRNTAKRLFNVKQPLEGAPAAVEQVA